MEILYFIFFITISFTFASYIDSDDNYKIFAYASTLFVIILITWYGFSKPSYHTTELLNTYDNSGKNVVIQYYVNPMDKSIEIFENQKGLIDTNKFGVECRQSRSGSLVEDTCKLKLKQ
jgi:hypothetical protein